MRDNFLFMFVAGTSHEHTDEEEFFLLSDILILEILHFFFFFERKIYYKFDYIKLIN